MFVCYPSLFLTHPFSLLQEQKLTPIETNIEIMKDRIQKLNLECDAEIPNAKTLQIVLQVFKRGRVEGKEEKEEKKEEKKRLL